MGSKRGRFGVELGSFWGRFRAGFSLLKILKPFQNNHLYLIPSFLFLIPLPQPASAAPPAPYTESLRPQFHFTSSSNWLNDPNGLVFYKSQYHLFFQHNPHSTQWGNMTWGHATSPDLLHWKQLPDAIQPDSRGTIFSGSAVVDWNNTSNLQSGEDKPLIALYTAAGGTSPESKGIPFTQCLAYSTDAGQTWKKWDSNPILPHLVHENRDPKVVRHEPSKMWIMALYLDQDRYALFRSPDLKHWTKLHELSIPTASECPDFFPIPLEGANQTKWVFTVADARYLVGDFDGQTFTPQQPLQRFEYGQNNYAVQTYSDTPDHRRIQIGWMRNGQYPNMPFNQQMTFPTQLKLRQTPDGPRLFSTPIPEIQSLHASPPHTFSNLDLNPTDNPLSHIKGDLFHILAEIDPGTSQEVGFLIHGQPVSYSPKNQKITALNSSAPLTLNNKPLRLEILVDRTSIETFVNDGQITLTNCTLPDPKAPPLTLFSKSGSAKILSLTIHPLKSAW